MNIICSVCSSDEDNDLRLLKASSLPGARYIACATCREEGMEPRPLLILGSLYGDKKRSTQLIKAGSYCGEEIKASEIL